MQLVSRWYMLVLILLLTTVVLRPLGAQPESDWYGYRMVEFNFQNHPAKIVFP